MKIVVVLSWLFSNSLWGAHGLALHGDLRYPRDFKHFGYVNPDAPRGGTLTISEFSTFDTLNYFQLKGTGNYTTRTLTMLDLAVSARDEPFSMYGGVAEDIQVAKDRLSMDVVLRKNARFSDGKPLTADDVAFSVGLTKSKSYDPYYVTYWREIKSVKVLSKHKLRFEFAHVNAELPLITLQIPIYPKHIYEKGDFAKDFASKLVGAGPYKVADFKFGSYIKLTRVKDWWGEDVPAFKGKFNFDTIVIKFFKDSTAQMESFKRGDFDFLQVSSSKRWATEMKGKKFDRNWIQKDLWKTENNEGGYGFLFNQRRKKFQDVRVRQAMALAFDFEWSNKNLFYGQYVSNESYFENSPLKAVGLPNPDETALLKEVAKDIPPQVFTKSMGYLGKGVPIKKRLRQAMRLLKQAGYKIVDGVATGPGGRLETEIVFRSASFARILEPYAKNLRKIGIKLKMTVKETSAYVKQIENRDFDLMVRVIGQSMSPGNEQKGLWGSKEAEDKLSRNYGYIKNKGVDFFIEKIIRAKSREDLVLYTKCLDRILYHLHPLVHAWHTSSHRVAYWNKFGIPETFPKFYSRRHVWETMWVDPGLAKRLDKAKSAGSKL